MRKTVFVTAIMMFVICGCKVTQNISEKQGENWQYLFDGKTLNGWVQHGGKAKFTVEDGAIVGTTEPNTHNSFLCTEKEYGNFIIELDFKVDPNLNSGLQFRSHTRQVGDFGEVVYGYQVDIDPSARAWTGAFYEELDRGWVKDLKDNDRARKAFKPKQWNHLRLEAIGSRIRTWINGVPAVDVVDTKESHRPSSACRSTKSKSTNTFRLDSKTSASRCLIDLWNFRRGKPRPTFFKMILVGRGLPSRLAKE